MKLYFILLLVLAFFLSGCDKEETIPIDFTDPCNYYIGEYAWLPSSLDKIAYADKDAVIFIDSSGHAISLNITYYDVFRSTEAIIKLNPDNENERIYYCYHQDVRIYELSGDSSSIKITLRLRADPYFEIPREGYTADRITVAITDYPYNNFISVGSFSKTVDQRTFPSLSEYIVTEPVFNCLGMSFFNVHRNNFVIGAPVYYNDKYGVVCFADSQGNQWRFDRFE